MKNRLVLSCLLGFLLAPYAYADDNPFSGGVFLGGRGLSLDRQSAKFNEYNDIGPGLFGGLNANYDNDKYRLDIDAAYLGDDDMYLRMNGGKWGSFKFSFFYTEFPHDYSFEDRTIYTDPGSQDLTLPGRASATPKNSNLWPSTSFDYKIERKDVGGAVDVTALSPFFFNVTANHLERQGDMPWSGHSVFGFSNTEELPLPIDDHTTNTSVLLGWKNKQFYAALGGAFSEYGNSAEFTRFQDPFAPGAMQAYGTIVGPPDNRSWNVSFNGTAKLPFSSKFALNASYTENTSQTTILNTVEDTVTVGGITSPTLTRLLLSQPTFNGDVQYLNLGANLTSNPVKDLTTKFYFKYLDRRNNSDQVTFLNPTSASTLAAGMVTNALFSYDKTNFGAEGTYRFMKNLKGIIGYDYSDTRREGGEDFLTNPPTPIGVDNVLDTKDNTFRGGLVYNPLDWLGGRLMYQKLFRNTDTELQPITSTTVNNQTILTYNNVTRFDIGNQTQDMLKFTADLTCGDALDVSFEYAYKLDDYSDTVLGLTKAEENEFILDGSYTWKGIKFFVFFDYDVSYTDQTGRAESHSNPSGNPLAAPSALGYNWNADIRNDNYAYGLGTTVPLIKDKLAFKIQYDFEKNQGYADFTSQFFTTAGVNNGNIDIPPWENYTRQNVSAMVSYAYSKNVTLNFGYLYSQFRLNDAQLNGYEYAAPGPAYLTGAYTDQNYNANVYYVKLYYRF